jgi:uncharacterized cofD-like protein
LKDPNIVVIGGGTGSFTLLKELKTHTSNITALVNMADSGGSTGVLRDELGVLPPGDIRQCLVALSESSEALRELFNYRFPKDTVFGGHSFGNLFLSATEKISDDFVEAVELASEVLNITGKVVPVTLENCHLVAEIHGEVISGEANIGEVKFDGKKTKPSLWLEPAAKMTPAAEAALHDADLIVIAPGNLYRSLAPVLLVGGMKAALQETSAPVAYVCNLVNKSEQTEGFAVHDYVAELERLVSPGFIDYVLYNTDKPSKALLEKYALEREFPVGVDDEILARAGYKAVDGHFLSRLGTAKRDENDVFLERSLIRHDAVAVSEALMKLVKP